MGERIGSGKTVILVYDNELKKCHDADFYKYLFDNYKNVSNKGICSSAPWVYVNIKDKTFFPAIPGINVTEALNEHAVTINEFYSILEQYEKDNENFDTSREVKEIYLKYAGKDPFVFFKKRFDCDEGAEEEKKLINESKERYRDLKEKTLYFTSLMSRKVKPKGNNFIIPKTEDEKEFLPSKGVFDALLHQIGLPGDEYLEYKVKFTDNDIILMTDGCTEECDLFEDLRVYKG